MIFILKKILNFLLFIITLFILSISSYLIYIAIKLPPLNINTNQDHNIEIYTSKNQKLNTSLYHNTYVKYEDISINLINALISVEDNTFFKHNGLNYKRIFQAFYKNIVSLSFKEGASTIDQQLIKNTILTSDKTINRKLSEILLTLKLEKYYTKEQIIELYLNSILFGDNIYGCSDASLYYFNKDVSSISVDEAALLAGLIQLPNYYNPYNNLDEAIKRRNLVIDLMYENGYISETDSTLYKNIDLEDKLDKNIKFKKESYLNSYLDYLSLFDLNSASKVLTYLDLDIQKELFDISNDKYNILKDPKLQVGMIVLDNETGGVLGISGNRSNDRLIINYALEKKQMASTMKPIIDYAPAFEYLNYSPATLIDDSKYTYSDATPLKNWDYKYKGIITLRQALRESRNIPALKLYQEIDNQRKINFLNKLNLYPTKPMYESEALGSGENTYSLLEIANCYLAFANSGKFINASPIKEIRGESYFRNSELKTKVMKESTAYFINSILHDVFRNSKFDLKDNYLCAKTGQTNFDDETLKKYNIPYGSTKDSYVIAYTKYITFGVWVGYDSVSSSMYLDNYKTQIPRTIMKIFMDKFANKKGTYKMPKDVVLKQVSINDNQLYLDNNGFYDYFIRGYEPKSYYKKREYYII